MSKKEGLIEKRTYDLIFDDDLDWDETHERVGTDMALLKEYWKMVMPIIDEAKKDLFEKVCIHCYWRNECQCLEDENEIQKNQPNDCFKNTLIYWFGSP